MTDRDPVERRTAIAPAAHIARRVEAAAREGFEPESVRLRRVVAAARERVEPESVRLRRVVAAAREGLDPQSGAFRPRTSGGDGAGLDDLEVEVVLVRRAVPSSDGDPGIAPRGPSRRRVLVGPVPFRDGDRLGITHAPRPHDRGWVTTVAVAGTALDDAGTGLVLAFVWCVDPDHLVPWGLHLHALAGEAFHDAPSVEVLRTQGTLVEAHPVALPAGDGTLSLWHGRDAHALESTGDAVDEPRVGVVVGSVPRVAHSRDGEDDPLADWVVRHMVRIVARQAQLVVVRDGEVVVSLAFASDGTTADPERAMRLGSVSKVVTGLVAAGVARRLGLPRGLDTPIGELGVLRPGGSALLPRITLAQLLDHTAGLVTSADLRADDDRHPLSESRIARDRGAPDVPPRPGDLLGWFEACPDDRVFVREPGSGRPEYGNESAILLGELLSRVVLGRDDGFETLVGRLFSACGIDVGNRGCLLGAGVARSIARREVTPRATSITWAPARFDPDREVVPSPYADNGPYLGGAAGIAVPLTWMGALIAAIGRRDDDPDAPTRADLDALTVPSPRDPGFGRGVMRGTPTYLTLRREGAPVPRPVRVLPLHHLGRIDGGSALLLQLLPIDPEDGTGLAAVVAFDRLGPLDPAVEGAELLSLVRARGVW